MIKTIIFDFDGVLFDSEAIHFQACNKIFSQFGIYLPYTEYVNKFIGLSDQETFQQVLNQNHITMNDAALENLIHQKSQAYENIVKHSEVLHSIKGVPDFLKIISQEIAKIGICSNSNRMELHAALDRMERGKLRKYFSWITTIDDVERGKPSPEGYLKTASHLDSKPENCLVIEDSIYGIKAAKSANMTVIAITTTHSAQVLTDADYVLTNYLEVTKKALELIGK